MHASRLHAKTKKILRKKAGIFFYFRPKDMHSMAEQGGLQNGGNTDYLS